MSYDWDDQVGAQRGSPAWFEEIDRRFLHSARLFATDQHPFDRLIPYESIKGRRVLEIGCGMGLHAELMARAGAEVTVVDLSKTSVEVTRARFALKGLSATVIHADAERLPFPDGSFDFVWSWGVIHHSARTGRIVREIARVLSNEGEARVMVYNRHTVAAAIGIAWDQIARGGLFRRTIEESLYAATDGYSARYYVREQFDDLFRTFFRSVSSQVCGQDVDALPLPRIVREPLLRLLPESYLRDVQARRGAFVFLCAREPE
jgi:2-polyprenyl-3-methyl-5-hydroxy-6-metoxy-1,4-benzoquinol methylase